MSEAETDTLVRGQAILSESRLATLLQKAETRLFDGSELGSPIEISLSDMPALVRHWSEAIARKATTLRKHAMGTLEALPTGCLYEHFDQTMWKRAALASEIFRHPEVSKNSGWLHTRALQEKFVKASVDDGRIELLIAWGQPKRNAGGLKTAGSLADLAELYAIARLGMIVTAIWSVLERDVDLTVLSGGRRFAQALYTDPVLAAKYDAQRQEIANLLCGRGVMTFCDYVSADFRDTARWTERYGEALEKITAEMIASEFGTVLLNVDWANVFSAADGNAEFECAKVNALASRTLSVARSTPGRYALHSDSSRHNLHIESPLSGILAGASWRRGGRYPECGRFHARVCMGVHPKIHRASPRRRCGGRRTASRASHSIDSPREAKPTRRSRHIHVGPQRRQSAVAACSRAHSIRRRGKI